eukprot:NODE_9557_length_581_cov_33.491266_g8920_i0.p1 GENE.NODE_9557_length_581_cov_33.491266_g8920_i0~~NODE_9557_length_581_cov_33.491266_g8920_i0.p1  ORF type:complete len:154 (-),score=11.13 NODE_9557_length_581_cov_33.491266_g8920_i0:41-502(-)
MTYYPQHTVSRKRLIPLDVYPETKYPRLYTVDFLVLEQPHQVWKNGVISNDLVDSSISKKIDPLKKTLKQTTLLSYFGKGPKNKEGNTIDLSRLSNGCFCRCEPCSICSYCTTPLCSNCLIICDSCCDVYCSVCCQFSYNKNETTICYNCQSH